MSLKVLNTKGKGIIGKERNWDAEILAAKQCAEEAATQSTEDIANQSVLEACTTVDQIEQWCTEGGKDPEFLAVFSGLGNWYLFAMPKRRSLSPIEGPLPPGKEVKKVETLTGILSNTSSGGSSGIYWFIC